MTDRTRRQSLAALAKSRGKQVMVTEPDPFECPAWIAKVYGPLPWVTVYAPTRRAAEAGLRAALEAMPERKERKR